MFKLKLKHAEYFIDRVQRDKFVSGFTRLQLLGWDSEEDDMSLPVATASFNPEPEFHEPLLEVHPDFNPDTHDIVCIKDWSENSGIEAELLRVGFLSKDNLLATIPAGFATANVYSIPKEPETQLEFDFDA